MRILVTGGAGFIGSHLCERLSGKHEVVALDNLITGKRENLKGIDAEFVKHDVAEPIPARLGKFDVIYNLASPASPIDYQQLPIETLLAGSLGMRNVLELARKNNCRVLHASTSEVYGDPLVHPQVESYWGNVNPIGPRSCYDESKRFAEALCMAYWRKFRTRVVIARIFNTYGERMRLNDGRIVPNFVYQALKNKPITVYGKGQQTRSFCYVGDMVDGLVALAGSKFSGDVFNIGNPNEYTVLEFAKVIKERCESKSKIIFESMPVDDPGRRKPNISKINKALGWKPKVGVDEGLARTIAWFRKEVHGK